MEVQTITSTKDETIIHVDNLTIAELLRAYLNKQNIEFAAWRRIHPTKPIEFRIQSTSKTVKKEISQAIAAIQKDLDSIRKTIKKK